MQAGTLVWADFGTLIGREQGGRRPALVISSQAHAAVTALVLVLPCTTRDRGWINHVALPSSLRATIENVMSRL